MNVVWIWRNGMKQSPFSQFYLLLISVKHKIRCLTHLNEYQLREKSPFDRLPCERTSSVEIPPRILLAIANYCLHPWCVQSMWYRARKLLIQFWSNLHVILGNSKYSRQMTLNCSDILMRRLAQTYSYVPAVENSRNCKRSHNCTHSIRNARTKPGWMNEISRSPYAVHSTEYKPSSSEHNSVNTNRYSHRI